MFLDESHVFLQSDQQSGRLEACGAVHGRLREEHREHLDGRSASPLHVCRRWRPAVQRKVWTVHRSKPAGDHEHHPDVSKHIIMLCNFVLLSFCSY